MRLAVVGSRVWADAEPIRLCLSHLSPGDVVVSGGAKGADRIAAAIAQEMGLEVVEYLPNWDLYGSSAGFVRNRLIVEDCDRLVAFWDGQSRGTMHSVNHAKKSGKPVRVFKAKAEAGAPVSTLRGRG